MAEVEGLCDRIAILRDGNLAFLGTPQALTKQLQSAQRLHVRFSPPLRAEGLRTEGLTIGACQSEESEEQGCLVFEVQNLTDGLLELSTAAKEQGVSIMDIHVERASLEQRFMDIAREVSP
jgi:ABC-2 type transport system ATP-binding protein